MIMKPLTDRRWQGYTLNELQEQKTINDARIMVQKLALEHQFQTLKTTRQREKGMFSRMLNALTYVDYAVLGVTLVRRIASIVSRFKK